MNIRRDVLLVVYPLLGASTEMLDMAAARTGSVLGIMLAYRLAGIAVIVPVWLLAGRPAIEARAGGLMTLCAALVIVQGPVYFAALRATGPTVVAAVSAVVPALVALASWALLGERLTWARAAWIAVVIVGAIGVACSGPRETH